MPNVHTIIWAAAASAMNFHTRPADFASNVVNSPWGMQITGFPPSQQDGSSQCHRIWLCDRWFPTFCPPGSNGVQNKALCAYIMWRRSARYTRCRPRSVSHSPGNWKGCSSNAAACCGRTRLAVKCSCTLVSSAFKNNTSLSANLAST